MKMSVLKLVALLCLFLILGSAQATKWTQCGIAGDFKVQNASLTPTDIYPGNSARFTIDAIAGDHDIEDGKITMLVRLAGLPIYTQQDNLCDKTSCPVAKNAECKLIYEQAFPEITPPGSYSVTLSGKSGAGTQLFCVIISFEVKAPSVTDNDGKYTSSSSFSLRERILPPIERISGEMARIMKSRKVLYPN